MTHPKLRVGVSSCLLGEPVRFDGGHKRDRFVTDRLGRFVEWVPVCPELEAGLGVPRPSMRLVREGDEIRLREHRTDRDHSARMRSFARKRVRALRALELCGYVLKKDSPSCGMTRVKIESPKGMPERKGRGLFAEALMEAFPLLPVEEEGRLNDPVLRENFAERLFAYHRLRELFRPRWGRRDVVAFHTAHKLELMAHSPQAYRELGRLVAQIKSLPRAEFRARYEEGFMRALEKRATPGRNTNVLQHMAGYVRDRLDAESRAELLATIEDYRGGLVSLPVPLTLLRSYARRFRVDYLLGQVYLDPHPKELVLRNHIA